MKKVLKLLLIITLISQHASLHTMFLKKHSSKEILTPYEKIISSFKKAINTDDIADDNKPIIHMLKVLHTAKKDFEITEEHIKNALLEKEISSSISNNSYFVYIMLHRIAIYHETIHQQNKHCPVALFTSKKKLKQYLKTCEEIFIARDIALDGGIQLKKQPCVMAYQPLNVSQEKQIAIKEFLALKESFYWFRWKSASWKEIVRQIINENNEDYFFTIKLDCVDKSSNSEETL